MTHAKTPPPEAASLAVFAQALTRRFGNFIAVDHVDLSVKPHEIFGFLGANGAGKTTTIRMLCGLLAPTGGEAWVDGLSISTQADAVKHRIGYMSQKFSLYTDLTLSENLEFYGGVYSLTHNEIADRSAVIMEQLGLTPFRSRLPKELPLGYRQRLALGCSVLHKPRILFLDEPTGGVDPVARRTFWDLIYRLADEGSTVFVTTHYMDEAEYCGRVSIMDKGQIVALGSPNELKREQNALTMQDVFLKVVKP
ncbi:ABC transporter ATP-binding protein [candidate division KSB1 bacterium]|nr:MAG: ABC transporter ATP-binding protein [candidate division KSB1 bacterium]